MPKLKTAACVTALMLMSGCAALNPPKPPDIRVTGATPRLPPPPAAAMKAPRSLETLDAFISITEKP